LREKKEDIMSVEKEVPVTTTPQSYADSALARVEEIRAMREKIPNLAIPGSRNASTRLVNAASVPRQFVELASMAVHSNASLVRGAGQDLAQDSDLTSFAEAYGPVADELEALASFIRHSVTKAKNKVGSEALTTYALARRLAKRPESADLLPHVDDMSKALGRRGRKAKAKQGPTQPSPKTPPSSTTAAKTD
jgi:hypothetical protein